MFLGITAFLLISILSGVIQNNRAKSQKDDLIAQGQVESATTQVELETEEAEEDQENIFSHFGKVLAKEKSNDVTDQSKDSSEDNNSDKTQDTNTNSPTDTPSEATTPTVTPTVAPTTAPSPPVAPTTAPTVAPTTVPTVTPTPTSNPALGGDTNIDSAVSFASFSLSPDGSATPNASGAVEFQITMNSNGYWDFKTKANFEMLVPDSRYQLWLCNINCSSTTQARFTTDSTGHASFSDVVINHAQWNDPASRVMVWQLSDPGEIIDQPNTCFMSSINSSACLRTSVGF